MPWSGSPSRRRAAVALILTGLVIGFVADLPSLLERFVRARLVRAAAARGYSLAVGAIGFGLPPRVELNDVVIEGHGAGAVARRVTLRLRPSLRGRRALRGVAWERAVVSIPSDLVLDLPAGDWDVDEGSGGSLRLHERGGPGRIELRRNVAETVVDLRRVEAGRLARTRLDGAEPVRWGTLTGVLHVGPATEAGIPFDLVGDAGGMRVAALEGDEGEPRFGAPLDLSVAAAGTARPHERALVLSCLRADAPGARLEAQGSVALGEHDVWADGELFVPRVSIADLLATSGVVLGEASGDLGSVELRVSGAGHLKDPRSIHVEQALAFTPPKTVPPGLAALRGPFTRVLDGPQGEHTVDLRPGGARFVPLDEVPPLFLRTLLISEDAGFWGHGGIDLAEVPVAIATNWNRGEKARGASTITQQLAKNLFLSRRKSYGRKLQELALTLLLESTLGKRRILEIYVNVIEWGPGLYGLRSAARHYFGKEPRDLTPREGAFLVALIPAPIRYQGSIRSGALSPRFGVLVDTLLAKLRSVDALDDEEYEEALSEELAFGREDASGSPPEDRRTDGPEPTETSPEATPAPGP